MTRSVLSTCRKISRIKIGLQVATGLSALGPGLTGAEINPIVTVTGGHIRGALLRSGGAVFKGVPYARPPVGDRLWREPLPVERMTSNFSAQPSAVSTCLEL
jgi:para-nitrobenzyl esterase